MRVSGWCDIAHGRTGPRKGGCSNHRSGHSGPRARLCAGSPGTLGGGLRAQSASRRRVGTQLRHDLASRATRRAACTRWRCAAANCGWRFWTPRACPTSRRARCTWSIARTRPPSRRSSARWRPNLGYSCSWLDAAGVLARSNAVRPEGLLGAHLEPDRNHGRSASDAGPSSPVSEPSNSASGSAWARRPVASICRSLAGGEKWEVQAAIVCTGHDFETLYPEMFRASGVTRCKLQMMRTRPQPEGWQLGPALAAGLTLRFYESFQVCRTLPALQGTHRRRNARVRSLGHSRARFPNRRWRADHRRLARIRRRHRSVRSRRNRRSGSALRHAVFSRRPRSRSPSTGMASTPNIPEQPYLSLSPAPNVRVVTATGGSGMTLSFGLAEETVQEMGF